MKASDIKAIFDAASARHDESWRASLYLTEEQQYASFSIMSGMVHPHTSLLDIGCGHGEFGATVRSRIPRLAYRGVDLSDEAIKPSPRPLQKSGPTQPRISWWATSSAWT